jgi:predicted nucleotidyltransferase
MPRSEVKKKKSAHGNGRKKNILLGLISSRIKIDVISVLLFNPDDELSYQDIVDRVGLKKRGNIAWALDRLEEYGYVIRTVSGKKKRYRINTENPIYPELKSIWMKTVGLFARLEERLQPLEEGIEFAFVYGSFADGTERADSDVDLMIIGTVRGRDVARALSGLDEELGREVHYSVFPAAEAGDRLAKGDHFWTRLVEGEKVFLIGDRGEFSRLET